MKLLLDECIDRRLARDLPGHFVRTVPQMGWATIKNGRLLRRAEKEFDVFVTVDRNLSFQQNLPKFDIAVAVLRARSNRLDALQPLAAPLLAALVKMKPGRVTVIG
jgi:predicted nuclease of predicted toxin-antitoxin system